MLHSDDSGAANINTNEPDSTLVLTVNNEGPEEGLECQSNDDDKPKPLAKRRLANQGQRGKPKISKVTRHQQQTKEKEDK